MVGFGKTKLARKWRRFKNNNFKKKSYAWNPNQTIASFLLKRHLFACLFAFSLKVPLCCSPTLTTNFCKFKPGFLDLDHNNNPPPLSCPWCWFDLEDMQKCLHISASQPINCNPLSHPPIHQAVSPPLLPASAILEEIWSGYFVFICSAELLFHSVNSCVSSLLNKKKKKLAFVNRPLCEHKPPG